MSEKIRCTYWEREYTYDELLQVYDSNDEDGLLITLLVRRCQKYEDEIERLRSKLQRVVDWLRHEANSPGGLASELELLTIAEAS